jgi:acyl-CoA hydrolase
LMASVNYVGNTSLVVGIKVISENVKTGTVKHTNTSYFTMVAKGEDDKPVQVPMLILENKTEVRTFVEAIYRRKFKKDFEGNMQKIKKNPSQDSLSVILADQRCINQSK